MKWVLSVGTVGFFALICVPMDLQAQKGKNNNNANSTPATPDDYKKLAGLKEFTGSIVSADRSTMVFRIDVPDYTKPANAGNGNNPNPNGKGNINGNNNNNNFQRAMQKLQQDMARLQQEEAQLARATPQQRQKLMQQIQQQRNKINQDMAQLQRSQGNVGGARVGGVGGVAGVNPAVPQTPNMIHKDFQLELADNVVFRKKTLGTEYDNETGNLKVYSDAEKAKLKGTDASKPGYAAKPEDLNPGAQVTIYFKAPATTAPKKDEDGNVITPKPVVRMVYLLTEGTQPLMIQGNAKKKAK